MDCVLEWYALHRPFHSYEAAPFAGLKLEGDCVYHVKAPPKLDPPPLF
jgi:hypothetical protein